MVTIKRKRRKIRVGSRCLPKNKHGNEPASFRFDLPWSRGNDCLSVKQRSTRWREAIQEWTMASNQPRICTGGRPVVYSKIDFDLAPRETVWRMNFALSSVLFSSSLSSSLWRGTTSWKLGSGSDPTRRNNWNHQQRSVRVILSLINPSSAIVPSDKPAQSRPLSAVPLFLCTRFTALGKSDCHAYCAHYARESGRSFPREYRRHSRKDSVIAEDSRQR